MDASCSEGASWTNVEAFYNFHEAGRPSPGKFEEQISAALRPKLEAVVADIAKQVAHEVRHSLFAVGNGQGGSPGTAGFGAGAPVEDAVRLLQGDVARLKAELEAEKAQCHRLTKQLEDSQSVSQSAVEAAEAKCAELLSALRDQCLCPIRQITLRDPVVALDGHTYSRRAFERWIANGGRRSPMTNNMLSDTVTTANMFAAQTVTLLRRYETEFGLSDDEAEVSSASPLSQARTTDPQDRRAFVEAVVRSDEEEALNVLRQGVDVNEALSVADCDGLGWIVDGWGDQVRFHPGSPALHLAACRGWSEVCRLALHTGAGREIALQPAFVDWWRVGMDTCEQLQLSLSNCAHRSRDRATVAVCTEATDEHSGALRGGGAFDFRE